MFLRKRCEFLPLMGGLVMLVMLGVAPSWSEVTSGQEDNFANFQNAPIDLVLDTYESLSGKHLIRENGVSSSPTFTLNSSGLSKAETLKLIESTLMLNGLVIIPIDQNTSKIVVSSTTKNPRSEGTPIYANAADFPPGEAVVSYYMPLTYISPEEAQNIFSQHAPPHPYGSYVPAPSAQAILLTENTSVIRQLIALQQMIDVPPAQVVNECVQLENSDAVEVAKIVTRLLDSQSNSSSLESTKDNSASNPLAGGLVPPASTSALLSPANDSHLLLGTTRIVPDIRSNRIIITTRPYNLPFLDGLISRLDEPGENMTPQRRQLRFVQAVDILPALQATLAQGKEEVNEAKAEQQTMNNNHNPSANNSQTSSDSTQTSVTVSSTPGTSGLPSNSTAISPQLKPPSENYVPQVVTVGRTRLLADDRSNSIIVFGSPDTVSKVFAMIDELDRQPLQVYLSTIIGQLTVTKSSDIGVDLLQKYANTGKTGLASSSITGTNTTSVTNVPDPTTLVANSAFPISSGLTLFGVIGDQINAYVRALESTNRFQVISRPSVFTTNNKLAVIASGSQVPVPASTTSGITGTASDLSTTSSIQYENVLLQLDIIPLINADHQVTLKIRQTNNSLGTPQVISGNSIPTILTQEINTEVTLPDRSTVVIGGLISETKQKQTTGVPLLSSIPFFGNLFKDTSKDEERDELIIMIQPTVIENPTTQMAANEEEKRHSLMYGDLLNSEKRIPTTNLVEKPRPSSPYSGSRSAFPVAPTPPPPPQATPPPTNPEPATGTNPHPDMLDLPDYIRAN